MSDSAAFSTALPVTASLLLFSRKKKRIQNSPGVSPSGGIKLVGPWLTAVSIFLVYLFICVWVIGLQKFIAGFIVK